MTALTAQQKAYVKSLVEESQWRHVFYYGGNDVIKPCKRVQKHKKTYENIFYPKYGGKMIEAYQATFINHTQQLPIKGNDISHICGKNSCVEISHMILESHLKNTQRRTCHDIILDWEKKHKNLKMKLGPLFVTDIPDETQYLQAKAQGLKRSLRNIKHHKCPHGDHTCFINYIKH